MAPHTAQFQNRHNQGGAHTHGSSTSFSEFRTATTHKGKLALKKRAPKIVTIITSSFHSIYSNIMIHVFVFLLQVETGKKTLLLHGTKTSAVLNAVLTQIYHLKKESAIKYSRKNDNIKPFEAGGETSLEFFAQKTDCSLFLVISHFLSSAEFCFCFGLFLRFYD